MLRLIELYCPTLCVENKSKGAAGILWEPKSFPQAFTSFTPLASSGNSLSKDEPLAISSTFCSVQQFLALSVLYSNS